MAKSKALKNQKEEELDFFSDMMDPSYDDEEGMMSEVLSGLIEIGRNQVMLAIELTKLVVEKNSAKEMNEDDVFAIFKKASGVIAESLPFKTMLEKLPTNN